LASLNSGRYESALRKEVTDPTLPAVLSDEGYTCLGVVPTPQADPVFGFDRGFDFFENFYDAGNRGKSYRDYLARFDLIRRLYHRIAPPHAKFDRLPPDSDIIDKAVKNFNSSTSPRFLWVHLNGPHRPYGRGDDAISKSIDRKALFSPNRLTDAEHEEIISKYRASLSRTDNHIQDLLARLDSDPTVVFTSDHGDEFGEEGKYFHQPQRRRVADALIEVPVVFDGIDIDPSWVSLIDIAPTIVSALDFDVPETWDGVDHTTDSRDHAITIAPWLDEATVAYQNKRIKLVAKDADVSLHAGDRTLNVVESDVPDDVEDRLRDLGYVR
jgi:arylsulfatase A-like enzyme